MKKIITLLLALLLLLSACTKEVEPGRTKEKIDNNNVNRVIDGNSLSGKDYIDLLKNFVVRHKEKDNTVDNEEFDKFLDQIFIETMESDYLGMNYKVIDYRAYGIEKPELTIGELVYCDDPDVSVYVDQMERLQSFDYDSLSYRQQYDYEILEYSLLETLAMTMYEKYSQLFTGGSDILADIVTNFDEFIFYDKEKLDDYMVLLADVDRYIYDAYDYTASQAEDGLYLLDYSIDYQIEYIDSYCSKVDDNVLITSFNKRIADLDFLSEAEKETYILENEKIVKEEIIPAFSKGKEELSQYYGKATIDSNRLINIDIDYAELVYMINTSNNEGIDTIFNNSLEMFDDYIALFNTAIMSQKNIDSYYEAYEGLVEPLSSSNEEILKFLEKNYKKLYPDLGEIEYEVSYLDKSSASDSVVAYYMQAPIDDLNQNVIRINPNKDDDFIESYTTLAHEGIPGHLYEHVHFYRSNPHNFRTTQGFIGYTEGYACYSQLNALNFLDITDGAKDIIFIQTFGGYVVSSIIDMAVNYYNWDIEKVTDFMNDAGFLGSYAESLVQDCIDRYGILDRYGIGYFNFISLKEYAKEKLKKNYNEIEFNEAILEHGDVPFCILKEAINEYIYGE